SAGRCVVITGTVSFPLFRSLRQLRRRTIPAPSPSVNRFFEKTWRLSKKSSQPTDIKQINTLGFFRNFSQPYRN
ncbi:hypothetical protein LQR33_12970, partial [Chromobacterium piscinae]|uniref:hypothetical protein n=1 Tax=Chromobacterium piscinae TaxID=686831 RepID=UPI001E408282